MFRKLQFLIAIWVSIAFLFGCSAQTSLPAGSSNTPPAIQKQEISNTSKPVQGSSALLVVTTDFGKEIVLEKTVALKSGTTAMDVLNEVAEVKTKYGGSFVNAINGIDNESGGAGAKTDWFFYVNGISSNVGAKDYIMGDGDIEHWDFRDWSYHHFIPAIIGDFPQPFLRIYGEKPKPVVIAWEGVFENQALSLAEKLNQLGIEDTAVLDYSQLSGESKEQSNLILIAGKDNELISELNDVHKKLGFYSYFEQDNLIALDVKGGVSSEYGNGSGLLQATQNPWNPKGTGSGENVVWLVSGVDEAGVKNAIDALINRQPDLQYAYAAVVIDGEIIKVP